MKDSHPLYGAHLRFQRADIHLTEADGLIRAFSGACKDYILTDDHGRIERLKSWPQIPLMLPIVISDAIHNMRAALDYIVYELALKDCGQIQEGTQFLIEDIKSDPVNRNRGFDARSKQYLKGLNPAHIAMIESYQPYNGVDWTKNLRDLSNPDKHRKLTVLSSFGRSVGIMSRPIESGRFGPTTFKNADGSDVTSRYDVELDAHDAIAIASAQSGEPSIMTTLRKIETELAGAISAFASEFP